MFIPSLPELTIKGKESVVQCPNEPNIIVAMTSTETRKGEVGVSKFITPDLPIPSTSPFSRDPPGLDGGTH
jgi:hypothetical protein